MKTVVNDNGGCCSNNAQAVESNTCCSAKEHVDPMQNMSVSDIVRDNDLIEIMSSDQGNIVSQQVPIYEQQLIIEWLNSFGLGQYHNNFSQNGYDTIEFIKDIFEHDQLIEIGIKSEQDRNKILLEIAKLSVANKLAFIGGERDNEVEQAKNVRV